MSLRRAVLVIFFAGAISAASIRAAAEGSRVDSSLFRTKTLVSVAGGLAETDAPGRLGSFAWRCAAHGHEVSRFREVVSFRVARVGATTFVRLAVNGRLVRNATLPPGKRIVAPPQRRGVQVWSVRYGTEAIRVNATFRISLGPLAGECVVPAVQATVRTIPTASSALLRQGAQRSAGWKALHHS